MARIFLSYRREDSAGFAGRLADGLEAQLGAGSVFRDVDDIRPGEDFVTAIRAHLAGVDAVLVMIGPRWLDAEMGGRPRLDDPDDFVRREIEAALASGKSVIPLLVGGASMPTEASLPAAIGGLARKQGVTLSDGNWRADVARLTETLRPTVGGGSHLGTPRRRLLLAGAGTAGVALLAWVLVRWRGPPAPAPSVPPPRADIAGRWTAQVKYDWGDQHDEVFEFRYMGTELRGSASYLTRRLAIEQAGLDGEWLRFVTHSQEVMGDGPWKEVTHRYTGQVTTEGIRFTLESSGGYTVHAPVEFVARRELD